jgi:hypothetical protein
MQKGNQLNDRRAKHMLWLVLAVVLFGVLAMALTPTVSRHLAIDRCLDAGGAFDYKTDKCIEGLQE